MIHLKMNVMVGCSIATRRLISILLVIPFLFDEEQQLSHTFTMAMSKHFQLKVALCPAKLYQLSVVIVLFFTSFIVSLHWSGSSCTMGICLDTSNIMSSKSTPFQGYHSPFFSRSSHDWILCTDFYLIRLVFMVVKLLLLVFCYFI